MKIGTRVRVKDSAKDQQFYAPGDTGVVTETPWDGAAWVEFDPSPTVDQTIDNVWNTEIRNLEVIDV